MGIVTSTVRSIFGASPENPATPLSNPAEWLIDMFGGPTSSGITINEETAMRATTVWRCVNLIADQIASVPWEMFQKGENGERIPAEKHPTRTLIKEGPSPAMTSVTYRRLIMKDLLMSGNAYSAIRREYQGRPTRIVYIPPQMVTPELKKDGKLKYDVILGDGKQEEFDQAQMIHIPGLGFDGVKGASVIKMMAEPVALSLIMEKYVARLHNSSSIAKGAIEVPGHMKPETWKNLLSGIKKIMTGDGFAVPLDQGMKWQSISLSPADAQTIENRKYQAIDICKMFGVPPQMIGESDSNVEWGNSLEQRNIAFVQYVLRCWAVAIEAEFNRKLIRKPYWNEFNLNGLMRGDSKSRADFYQSAIQNGWMTPNEVRKLENLPQHDDGDTLFINGNMRPIDEPYSGGSNAFEQRRDDAASSEDQSEE